MVWGYRETDVLGGPDPYSASKGVEELVIGSHVKSFFPKDGAVRIAIGRAGNVIGGGDWAQDRIIPDCVCSWAKGDSVQLRNPLATRPWQHVLEPLSGYLAHLLLNYIKTPKFMEKHSILALQHIKIIQFWSWFRRCQNIGIR